MSKHYAHAIKVVSQFAATDRTLNTLTLLHIESFDGHVIIKATDRYTLAAYTVQDETATAETPAFLIDPKIGKALGAQHGDYLTLEHLSAAQSSDDVESFPNIDRLIPSADALAESDGVTNIAFNGNFLARFKASVLGRDTSDKKFGHVKLSFTTSSKPALVEFGDYFKALIVPVRVAN